MFNLVKPFYPLFFSAVKSNIETTHLQSLAFFHWLDCNRDQVFAQFLLNQLETSFCFDDSRLQQSVWGLNFKNPLGLAAGYDKDGKAAGIWSSFGFGFASLGAVTFHPQPGNPRPRMFRLPLDKAALNRMGANSLGAIAIAEVLTETWARKPASIPIGINLCKSKITPLEDAAQDYLGTFKVLQNLADYFVINVSSPNTEGLRSLQGGEKLAPILEALQTANQASKPILIKISPDLEDSEIIKIVKLAQNYQLNGIIATNTTISRENLQTKILTETGKAITDENGGISGKPLKQRSTEVIRLIWRETEGCLPIIGVGGIFTAEDAWEKITAGATLLQFYTGWVYQGAWCVPDILQGLLTKLDEHNLTHISEAIAINN